jgi:hypothetical protein
MTLLAGCSLTQDQPIESSQREGNLATTLETILEPTAAEGGARDLEPSLEPVATAVIIGTRRIAVQTLEAEDGWGSLIEALDPVAVEIEAEYWPGRALDPVLHVDDRRFHIYTHPGPGRIQFVLAEAAWLDEADALSIRYDCPEGCIADPEVLLLPTPAVP